MVVDLTEDEITFLTAAWQDSDSEGCFSRLYGEVADIKATHDSLVAKGVIADETDNRSRFMAD